MEIRFKNLSKALKTFVVLGWAFVGIESVAFIYGFFIGLKYGLGY